MEWIPWASPDLDSPDHLEPLCVELQRVIRGETIEVCVSVPPRHGKSTTVHHAVAMLLAASPKKRVLYASYDAEFASINLKAIRRICLAVGLAIGDKDGKFEFRLAEGGGVTACGIQAPPTGLGYDLVIVDDPIRRLRDALSPAIREAIGNGFSADLYSRQMPGSKRRARKPTSFVVVATRWHHDDLTGRLTKLGWQLINLPAVSIVDGEERALAPAMFSLKDLDQIRRQNDYTWASLYMGDPSPRVGRMFGDVHLIARSLLPQRYRVAFGVDIARGAKQRSDRQAVLEMMRDTEEGAKSYVTDWFAARMPLTDHLSPAGDVIAPGFAGVLSMKMKKRPGARAVQYTGGDEDLVLDLLAKLKTDRVYVEARRAVRDKRARASPAATAWNRGDIMVVEDLPDIDNFLEHLLTFTGADGAEDEEADCLAAAFDALSEGPGSITAPKTSARSLRPGLKRGRRNLMS